MALRLILGMEVSAPPLVALLMLVELVNRGQRPPVVENWMLYCGPETCGGGGEHGSEDEVVSVDVLAVSLEFDSRASEESLACS